MAWLTVAGKWRNTATIVEASTLTMQAQVVVSVELKREQSGSDIGKREERYGS